MEKGKNNAAMRGRKDSWASPCEAKPMSVRTAIARISPTITIDLFMLLAESIFTDIDSPAYSLVVANSS